MSHVIGRILAAALLLLSAQALPARAQEPAPPPPTAPPSGDFTTRTTPDDYVLRKVERVNVDDVWPGPGGERVVEVYLRALTAFGEPVENLRPVDLEVREDANPIDKTDVWLASLEASGRGISCVLVLDVSRTMRPAFEQAKKAAVDFMDRLGARDRVAVVTFAGAPETVAPFDMPRQKARVFLEHLSIDESSLNTTLYDGVHSAIELIRQAADIPRRAFVIVLSDGRDGGSNHSLEQAIELANGTSSQARILAYTIGYERFGGTGLDVLRRLSKETGGEFFQLTNTAHLGNFYGEILSQLMKSYVARFASDMDGQAHTVEVVIEGQKANRVALYPDIPRPLWPFLAGGGGALLLLLLVWLVRRARSAGRLVFVAGPKAGQSVALKRGTLRIGALPDNDIVIPHSTVSRYHAEVHVKGRKVEVEDLRSNNGTLVNGAAIQRSPVRPGDRITIADVDLVFER